MVIMLSYFGPPQCFNGEFCATKSLNSKISQKLLIDISTGLLTVSHIGGKETIAGQVRSQNK